jgi:prepilin-type N-terminal cleavage/methylation domain-containing protein
MPRTTPKFASRAGVTLIELLVVVTILVMLMAYATSMVKPALEDRKSRETAQLLNSYFTNAQARAAELGRPVGVYLERSPNDDNKVLQMYTAVTPPPFVGSVANTRAGIVPVSATDPRAVMDTATPPNLLGFDLNIDGNNTADRVDVRWIYEVTVADAFFAHPLIKRGNTVKFDYKGRRFQIWSVAASQATPTPVPTNEGVVSALPPGKFEFVALDSDARHNAPAPTHLSGKSLPLQVFRAPQKSIAAPIEVPTGMAIDLIASGFGTGGNDFMATTPAVANDDKSPIVIMYRPSGDLDYVVVGGVKSRPIEPIHLLVGSYEYDPLTQPVGNLTDARNRWITIRPRGGNVFATEVSVDETLAEDYVPTPTELTTYITKSRVEIRRVRGR